MSKSLDNSADPSLNAPGRSTAPTAPSAAARRLRDRLPYGAVHALSRVRRATERSLGQAVAAALRILPLRVRAQVRERSAIAAAMDYGGGRVELMVDSEVESLTRLHSCRKEPETVAWIETFIAPGDVVYDIGANVGAYSFVINRFTRGAARVYAFEPSFSTFNQLSRNVLHNGMQDQVTPLFVALSSQTGLATLEFSSVASGAALHRLRHGTSSSETLRQPVLMYRLDDFVRAFRIPTPNHLKIDVDGGEADILAGAAEILNDPALRSVLIEVEPGAAGAGVRAAMSRAGLVEVSRHAHGSQPHSASNSVFARPGS